MRFPALRSIEFAILFKLSYKDVVNDATPPTPPTPPTHQIDKETLKVILQADIANVVKKCKAGKPLSKADKEVLLQAAGIEVNSPRRPDGTFAPGARAAAAYSHGGYYGKPKWNPRFIAIAREIAKNGLTDEEVAATFGVSERTLRDWKKKHKPFATALRLSKEPPDKKVERSLFQRATGYSHSDVDIRVVNGQVVQTPIIKHYPPDTTAAIYWTKNRRPDRWRDKTEVVPQNPDGSPLKLPAPIQVIVTGAVAPRAKQPPAEPTEAF
jgi:transposase-like protein